MEIQGYFADGKPMINVYLEGSENLTEVLVDTGFNGELMMTMDKIQELGKILIHIGDDKYMTASGEVVPTSVYMGYLKWFGRTRKVTILATSGKSNLIGMELLHFYRLNVARSQNQLKITD